MAVSQANKILGPCFSFLLFALLGCFLSVCCEMLYAVIIKPNGVTEPSQSIYLPRRRRTSRRCIVEVLCPICVHYEVDVTDNDKQRKLKV